MSNSVEHSSTAETEFAQILREISDQGWSLEQWAQHEAGDWFQTEHFLGGFDADKSHRDGQFTFTYYDQHRKEWWFTFALEGVETLKVLGFKRVSLIDPGTFDVSTLKNGTD
ncbi:MAG: hypothetical protein EOP84_03685 [Verrucomicrobiaceae bacterium]|nr:MAG: hypothetical protein EOP84_03685 [Verrucomicrobiaceae bacterium]